MDLAMFDHWYNPAPISCGNAQSVF